MGEKIIDDYMRPKSLVSFTKVALVKAYWHMKYTKHCFHATDHYVTVPVMYLKTVETHKTSTFIHTERQKPLHRRDEKCPLLWTNLLLHIINVGTDSSYVPLTKCLN